MDVGLVEVASLLFWLPRALSVPCLFVPVSPVWHAFSGNCLNDKAIDVVGFACAVFIGISGLSMIAMACRRFTQCFVAFSRDAVFALRDRLQAFSIHAQRLLLHGQSGDLLLQVV